MAVTQITTNESTGNIPTVGVKEIFTTGNTIYVDSNNGAATNNGLTSSQAVTTLALGVALTTANRGDVIFLMPNHAETLSAELSISTAGITIFGLGNGDNRPVITMDNTAASITLATKNVRITNVVFKNDVDSQVEMIDVANAAYTQIDNCLFLEGSAKQCLIFISITNAGADYVKILNNTFIEKTAGATSAISIGAAVDHLEIANNKIYGDWSDAGIQNPTGNVATNLAIHDNYIENDQTGDHAIQLVSACTGGIYDNVLYADAIGTVLDPGSCKCAGNKAIVAINQGSTEIPLADADTNSTTTDNLHGKIGTDTEMSDNSLFDLLGGSTDVQGLPVMVTKATAALPQSTDGTLFTVSGGQVEILALVGEVTTVIETQANASRIKFNPTGTGADVNLSGTLDITADAVGTLYSLTGIFSDPLQSGLWVTHGLAVPIVLGPGVIELECAASNTGSVGWQLVYRPLESGASVA